MPRRQFAPKRMQKQWGSLIVGGASVDLTGNSTTLIGTVSIAQRAETILRGRGEVFVAIGATTTALDEARVGFGLGIVSGDAATLGSTAMPDPIGDPDYPWLWWHVHHFFSPFVVDGTGSDGYGVGVVRIPLDTKAMRKVKPEQGLVLVVQYVDVTGTPALRAGGDVRCLLAT